MLGTVGVSTLTALGGCLGDVLGNGGTGTLATHISDDPGDIEDFESCVVTVTSIDVKRGDATADDGDDDADAGNETATESTADGDGPDEDDEDGSEEDGVETFDVDDAEVDLTEVQDDRSQLVSEVELETGDYAWLRVNLDSEIDAELTDGSDADVMVPSNGLKLNMAFEIRADTTTNFTADFTPVKRGQANSYNIQPVTQEVTVTYGDSTEGDGTTQNDGTNEETTTNETTAETTA